MYVSWRTKRQLIFFGFFAILILLTAGVVSYGLLPDPTCGDGKRNNDEEGIDCGGPCRACVFEEPKDLLVLWTRYLQTRPQAYDVFALIENLNVSLGAGEVLYSFRLLDAEGSLITSRNGTAYVRPHETLLLVEPELDVGVRVPARITLSIKPVVWTLQEKEELPLRIVEIDQQFSGERPRLRVVLLNDSLVDAADIDVAVLLTNSRGNAVGAGTSFVHYIAASGTAETVFTWVAPFTDAVDDVQVFLRKRP